MNGDYESMVKEIDEMLAIREIDKFLDKIEKKKNIKKVNYEILDKNTPPGVFINPVKQWQ